MKAVCGTNRHDLSHANSTKWSVQLESLRRCKKSFPYLNLVPSAVENGKQKITIVEAASEMCCSVLGCAAQCVAEKSLA